MKHINEILKECLNTMEKNMSHRVPHADLYKNQGMIMPDTPNTKYSYNCKKCEKPFDTNYQTQKYCNDPCRYQAPLKGKPEKKAPRTKSQISRDNLKKLRAKEEKARQFTLLQRKMFSKRL